MKIVQALLLAVGLLATCARSVFGQDEEAADTTRPGLASRYTSLEPAGKTTKAALETIEAVPRLFAAAGQSPHSAVSARGFQAAWHGLLMIPFQGTYTFTARRNTLSDFSISLDGKPVPLGTTVELPQGPVALRISGKQTSGDAAFELWWRSDYFADEPIEARHFRHDPAAESRQVVERSAADRGAVLAETYGCFRCHENSSAWTVSLADGLNPAESLPGPDLHGVAQRVNATWLLNWLKNPHATRPGTSMPRLFTDSPDDELAARTIAAYLMMLEQTGDQTAVDLPAHLAKGDERQGEAAYKALGCAACHAPPLSVATAVELVSAAPKLDKLAEKWTRPGLVAFLQNPLQSRAHGRMPDFGLTAEESTNLAEFLINKTAVDQPTAMVSISVTQAELDEQWRKLAGANAQALAGGHADQLVIVATAQMAVRQCTSCHELPENKVATIERRATGAPAIRFARGQFKLVQPPTLKHLDAEKMRRGCLSEGDSLKPDVPNFNFLPEDRLALVAYLNSLDDSTAASTADRLRTDLALLNCLRCHDNEGQGGESLAALIGGDDHAKYYRPPMLTRVGERLRLPRMQQWIGQGARQTGLRPWVGAKMPGFGPRASRIANALATRDGATGPTVLGGPAAPVVVAPQIQSEHVQTGRFLVGTKALACINCHTLGGKLLAGQPDATTRGPDLTLVADHLRPEYFQRWVMNPARIRPGTKMPQAIQPDGKVAIASLKSLPPGSAINALWTYLSQGKSALAPADEPTVIVLPQVGAPAVQRGEVNVGEIGKFPRAVALGFADGTLLFDADQLAPVAAWYGSFIKPSASPYFGLWWSREGSEPDILAGNRLALAFQLTDSQDRKSFDLPLESDPNVGTRWEGYQVGRSSVRVKYRLLVAGHRIQVTEDVRLESRPDWQGFARAFRFDGLPAGARVLLALPSGANAKIAPTRDSSSTSGQSAANQPNLTYNIKDQTFVAVRPNVDQAGWLLQDHASQTTNGQEKAAQKLSTAQLVSAPAKSNQPVAIRVDLWRYRGKNAAPTAGETEFLVANPPLLDDDFDRPLAPPAPVAVAPDVPAEAEVAAPPKRTRPAVNPQENVDEFAPASARFVRFSVLRTSGNDGPGIDELEIYGADPKLNLALGGKASASSVIGGYKIHQVPHLNDGQLGNNFSWIGNESGKGWVMVELPQSAEVRKVVWARDRTGVCKDRLAVGYRVEVSTNGVEFRTVSDDSDRIATLGAGVVTADASPGYLMQSLELPFADCRMSDIAFAEDGTLYALAMTEGQVWRTKTPPPDRPAQLRWQRFASGLYHPIGIQIIDGRVFVAQKPEITELVDRDGDGTADEFRSLASGWGLSTGWHEYTFGLAADPRKNLWFALNTGYFWTNPGYVNPGRWRGSVMRLSYEADKLEVIAKGCRVPNGIVCGTDDQIFFTDNQGDWIQSCKVAHVVPGKFYGHPEYKEDALPEGVYPDGRSAVWMPYNNSRSTSGPVCDKTDGKFGPFAGQMFVGDVGYGGNPGIMRVVLEKINGEYQGAVMRFVDGQPLGCERMKFGPDKQLYMASLTTGLTRLKFIGPTPLAIERVAIRKAGKGFELELTKPLAADTTLNPADFHVRCYHYDYTGNYGSPEADAVAVNVASAELSADRKKITLSFPVESYPIGMIYEINAGKLRDEEGNALVHNQAWYTVHQIPK